MFNWTLVSIYMQMHACTIYTIKYLKSRASSKREERATKTMKKEKKNIYVVRWKWVREYDLILCAKGRKRRKWRERTRELIIKLVPCIGSLTIKYFQQLSSISNINYSSPALLAASSFNLILLFFTNQRWTFLPQTTEKKNEETHNTNRKKKN